MPPPGPNGRVPIPVPDLSAKVVCAVCGGRISHGSTGVVVGPCVVFPPKFNAQAQVCCGTRCAFVAVAHLASLEVKAEVAAREAEEALPTPRIVT